MDAQARLWVEAAHRLLNVLQQLLAEAVGVEGVVEAAKEAGGRRVPVRACDAEMMPKSMPAAASPRETVIAAAKQHKHRDSYPACTLSRRPPWYRLGRMAVCQAYDRQQRQLGR